MATKERGSSAYGKIEHESGKKSYAFAQKFIVASGIEATLNTHADACIDDEDSRVLCQIQGFQIRGRNFFDHLEFDVLLTEVNVKYSRVVASSDTEVIDRADLHTTLRRMVRAAGYNSDFFAYSGNPSRSVAVTAQVPTDNYKELATFIGSVDRMISLYLQDAEREKTARRRTQK